MTSWPGTSKGRSTAPVSLDDKPLIWDDQRNEIFAVRPTLPRSRSLEGYQPPRWTAAASTATGTVRPVSPRTIEEFSPRALPTAPILGSDTQNFIRNDADLDPRTQLIYKTHSNSSTPFSQSNSNYHGPSSIKDKDAKLASLLEEAIDLHKDLSAERVKARGLRNTLRQMRANEGQIRLAFQNKLNSINPRETDDITVQVKKALEELSVATESYLTLEIEYHKVDDAIEQKEYKLNSHMTKLTSLLRKRSESITKQHHDVGPDFISESKQYASTGNVLGTSLETADYPSLTEHVRILRERLEELACERRGFLGNIDQNQALQNEGGLLDNALQLILDQYEDKRIKIGEELNLALIRLENHPEYKNSREKYVTDEEWRDQLREFLPDPPDDQPPPDPLRASELEDRSPFFETARPLPLNKSTFINHWLLYRLRHSAVEVLQFKSQPELLDLMDKGWDRDSISQMAMRLWYQDGTTMVETAQNNSGVQND